MQLKKKKKDCRREKINSDVSTDTALKMRITEFSRQANTLSHTRETNTVLRGPHCDLHFKTNTQFRTDARRESGRRRCDATQRPLINDRRTK